MAAGSTAEDKFLRGSALEEEAPTTMFERWFVVRKTLVARLKIEAIIRRVQPCCNLSLRVEVMFFPTVECRNTRAYNSEARFQSTGSRMEQSVIYIADARVPQENAFVTRYQWKRTFTSAELTVSTTPVHTRLRLHHSTQRTSQLLRSPCKLGPTQILWRAASLSPLIPHKSTTEIPQIRKKQANCIRGRGTANRDTGRVCIVHACNENHSSGAAAQPRA